MPGGWCGGCVGSSGRSWAKPGRGACRAVSDFNKTHSIRARRTRRHCAQIDALHRDGNGVPRDCAFWHVHFLREESLMSARRNHRSRRAINSAVSAQSNRFETLERRLLLASISGVKYNDVNQNGVKEAAEAGIPGWVVYLDTGALGSYDATAVTSSDVPKSIL